MSEHDRVKPLHVSWVLAAAVMASGCQDWSRPVRAESGLASRAQAVVATTALAVSRAQPSAARSVASPDAAAERRFPSARRDGRPTAVPAQPVAQPADLRVKRLVLARDVEAREPVGAADRFALDEVGRIYAFVEVDNRDQVESEIFVTFEPAAGPARGHVRLRVGPGPRWRTWAYSRGVRTAGSWTAVVRDGEGELLAKRSFEVAPAPPAEPDPAPAAEEVKAVPESSAALDGTPVPSPGSRG